MLKLGWQSDLDRKLFVFVLVNLAIAFLISFRYHSNISINLEFFYISFAQLAQLGVFSSVLYFFFSTLLKIKPLQKILFYSLPIIYTLLLILLYIDTLIFDFFKNHFNSLVLNVLLTPGGWESLDLTKEEFIIASFLIVFTFVFQWTMLSAISQYKGIFKPLKEKTIKIKRFAYAAPFCLLILSSLIYAFGDLYDIPPLKSAAHAVPMHKPLTIKSAYLKIFDELPTPTIKSMNVEDSKLVYPLEPMEFNPITQKPNILWIVIDCLRTKAFSPETSPHLHKMAKNEGLYFNNHHSGGNATRNGLFSLFYGVYSSYWDLFLAENQSPILIDRMIDLNYQFGIFSSTALTFPEFRKTIFIKLNSSIKDDYEGQRYQRDLQVLESSKKIIFGESPKPYFIFAFLDSAHSKYSYPPDEQKFEPVVENYSYSSLTEEEKSVHLRNRYRNAVSFLDNRVSQLLKEMKAKGKLKNTIVLITGDHGEEFNEYGHVGHSGAYTREQIQVPLMILWPDKKAKSFDHFSTHYDIVPTFAEALGAKTNSSMYSMGHSLFEEKSHNFNFACGWDKCSILDKDGFVLFGYPGRNTHFMEFRNNNYQVIQKTEGLTGSRAKYLNSVLKNMGRFSK